MHVCHNTIGNDNTKIAGSDKRLEKVENTCGSWSDGRLQCFLAVLGLLVFGMGLPV